MPIFIQRMTDEVSVVDGDMPLSKQQIDLVVQAVLQRLDERERMNAIRQEATKLHASAEPGYKTMSR